MIEKLTQLGLAGFGKEIPSQLTTSAEAPASAEINKNTWIVPLNTTIFRHQNPDLGFTVVKPFYVTKRAEAQAVKGLVRVVVGEDDGEVYRDGSRYSLQKGEVLEVPIKRLIVKKSS